MNLLGDALEYFKKNIKEIVLLINVVGFVNYFIYYNAFGISIFSYVGLNDLIFFVLEYVFPIVLIFASFAYPVSYICFLIRWKREQNILYKKNDLQLLYKKNKVAYIRVNKLYNQHLRRGLIIVKIVFSVLFAIVVYLFPFKQYTVPAFVIYAICFFVSSVNKINIYILASIIAAILVIYMLHFKMNEAIDKRDEKQDYTISFVENNELITTEKGESTLNYIGESSIAIFLYDIEQKEARVFIKSNLSDIRIQSKGNLEIIVNHIINTKAYQLFFGEEEQ